MAVIVRDLNDHRRFRRVLSDLAYDHVRDGCFIRPILLRSTNLRPRDARPSELAEDILQDGVEVA